MYKVVIIKEPPVFLDKEKTISKVVALIEKAWWSRTLREAWYFSIKC